MIEILVYVAIALIVVVVALLAYAAAKPDAFRVQRSRGINAPAERIFPLIANLKSMNTWNPFVEPDPAIKIAYSGPESGKSAAHTWSGNSKVGRRAASWSLGLSSTGNHSPLSTAPRCSSSPKRFR